MDSRRSGECGQGAVLFLGVVSLVGQELLAGVAPFVSLIAITCSFQHHLADSREIIVPDEKVTVKN